MNEVTHVLYFATRYIILTLHTFRHNSAKFRYKMWWLVLKAPIYQILIQLILMV